MEEKELAALLVGMGCAETDVRARQDLARITSSLRTRGLADPLLPKTKRAKVTRWQLTDAGARWLRDALGLARTPSWHDLRDKHFGSLALGLQPGSERSIAVMKGKDTLLPAILGAAVAVEAPHSLVELCDALLRERLKITTKNLTLDGIRRWLLIERVRDAGFKIAHNEPSLEGSATGKKKRSPSSNMHLLKLAASVSTKLLNLEDADKIDKNALDRALTRHWIFSVKQVARVYAPRANANSILRAVVAPTIATPSIATPSIATPPIAAPPIAAQPIVTQPQPPTDDQLLAAVKGAIPQIGTDGRYGAEKVFVSALWNQLERDGHGGLLPFDHFKQWLVTANRKRLLDLARADMVVTMDPRLVSASEIQDLGATFHFVLDRQVQQSGAARRQPGRA